MAREGYIHPVFVPKWGLTMEDGVLVAWRVAEGSHVAAGDELLEIETSKITNTVQAAQAGVLRRQVGEAGRSYPCGALIGVIAETTVPEDEITAFVAKHAHSASKAPPETKGSSPETLEVRGHALRYLARGVGTVPILFIHGLGGDLDNWMFVQPPLSEGRATYAVDLPGHGGSSKHLAGLNAMTDVADLLVAFMDQLTIDRVHLVGHSMGAAVAVSISRQCRERVASLTLLSPAGLGYEPSPLFISALIEAANRREVSTLLKMLVADESTVTRRMVDDLLKYKRLDGVPNALRQLAALLVNDSHRQLSEALGGIDSPVHVILGAQDRILLPSASDKLPDSILLSVVEDAGHMAHMERSSKVVELIKITLDHCSNSHSA
jgi:pyruvate dehydrogenase E2 component (dihydrolipoamide acetyltransferase)